MHAYCLPALWSQVNLDDVGSKRDELLSTGIYSLVNVACRGCSTVLVRGKGSVASMRHRGY